jgi:nitrogen fixation NifU-like protein
MIELWSLPEIPWTSILVAGGLIFAVIGLWVWLQQKLNPTWGTIDQPDATAYSRGTCGDSMKISLKFLGDRVTEAKYWTDGCRMSSECGAAAARLALNKTPEEIADIDYLAIEKEVGGLPEEDRHCATLAAGTLQECVKTHFIQDHQKTA